MNLLLAKVKVLSLRGLAQVEDIVDLLPNCDDNRCLTANYAEVSYTAFAHVWENNRDAEYDGLYIFTR